jgi:uncharacterized protein Yka (UPF0111/DUF47 family)
MNLLEKAQVQLEEIEGTLEAICKQEVESIEELMQYISHCIQEAHCMRNNLRKLENHLYPHTPDDYDGGLASYR